MPGPLPFVISVAVAASDRRTAEWRTGCLSAAAATTGDRISFLSATSPTASRRTNTISQTSQGLSRSVCIFLTYWLSRYSVYIDLVSFLPHPYSLVLPETDFRSLISYPDTLGPYHGRLNQAAFSFTQREVRGAVFPYIT